MEPMTTPLPLPTLLSQVLVAHTMELDNEAEHRLPHRTTRGNEPAARRGAPWLVSFALWANVLQYLDEDTVTVAELRARARTTRLLLGGLRRWGYVTLTPAAGETLQNPPQDSAVVRTTRGGRVAQDVFRALLPLVDDRWRIRFGAAAIDRLEQTLRSVFDELPIDPPAYLPMVYPTQNGKAEPAPLRATRSGPDASVDGAGLSPLLAGVLLAFTLDFERESRLSLPISANTLRVLGPTGVRIRDLPQLTGVSKEANAMCAGWLERHGCARSEPDPTASRGKVLLRHPEGSEGPAEVPSPPRRHRGVVGDDVRSRPRRPAGRARTARRGWNLGLLSPGPGARALPGQLARRGPATPPRPCRTTPWCCTAGGTPTAADGPRRAARRMWQA